MDEKISRRCAIALEIARTTLEKLTGNPRVGKYISKVPTGSEEVTYLSDPTDGNGLRHVVFVTTFYFPQNNFEVECKVTLEVVDDKAVEPEVKIVALKGWTTAQGLAFQEDGSVILVGQKNMSLNVAFLGDVFDNYAVRVADNTNAAKSLVGLS